MSEGVQAGQSVEVVIKADEILGLLREHGELSIAQITDGVSEPRSSVYRLIATLEDMGFVEPSPRGGGYRLGLRLFALGKLVAAGLSIVAAARPVMEDVFEATGETVFLMIREDVDALCLERIDGRRVQSMAVEIGGTLPLHLGAAPIVLLAHAPEEVSEEYLRASELRARTKRSITDPAAIRDRLAAIREHGHAISDEDLVPGIAAIGAPVRDRAGEVVAALSMSGARESVLTSSAERSIALIRDAAGAIDAPS